MKAFLILNWRHGEATQVTARRVDLAERRGLLPNVMKAPGPFFTPDGAAQSAAQPSEDDYIGRFSGVPVYEILGGIDFSAAVAAINEIAER